MRKKFSNQKISFVIILLFLLSASQIMAADCGDVNSSGKVDIVDALLIAKDYVGSSSLPMSVADVSGDNKVDIVDALLVAQYYVGVIKELKGCKNDPTPTKDAGGNSKCADCNSITNQKIITVATDGSGQYKTVKSALGSISKSNTSPILIKIKPGIYDEKIVFDKSNVTLCGQKGKAKQTIITHKERGTSTGYSVKITSNDVSVENMTIRNTQTSGQAPALMITGNRIQFRNSQILGFQDTLYARDGTSYFRDCLIEGRVDYIFGHGTSVYENCEIRTVQSGSAMAAPATPSSTKWGLVFLGGKLTATSNIKKKSQWLARSWRAEGFAAFIGVELGDHIKPEGWGTMGGTKGKLDQARFYEYKSTGPGANPGARAKEVAPQLSDSEAAKYTIKNIFGSWTPCFSQ